MTQKGGTVLVYGAALCKEWVKKEEINMKNKKMSKIYAL